jgi:hypothetical protein
MPIEFLGLSPPEKMAPPLQGFELETNRNKTVFFPLHHFQVVPF